MPRIYVGNLAESVTQDDLTALFSGIGRVRGSLVITDRLSGRSRGFGFVEMVDVDEAIDASSYFNNTELGGLKIQVQPFRPREEALAGKAGPKRRLKRKTSGSAN